MMKRSNLRAAAFALVSVAFAAAARADTRIWDGGGADNKWSTAENWSDDTVPGAGDVALFDGTSTKDATIDVAITIGVIRIKAEYTGTITQAAGVTITAGSEWKQDGGAFTGSDGAISIGGPFTLKGGSFAGGRGSMTVSGQFKLEQFGSFDAASMTLEVGGPFTLTKGTFSGSSSTIAVSGVFKQDDGVLNVGEADMSLRSHLVIAGGTFNAGTSRFTFIGDAEQVADFTYVPVFHCVVVDKTGESLSFVKRGFSAEGMSISPGDTVYFTTQDAITLGRMCWLGRPGELITVRSMNEGDQWELMVASDQRVCYVDVKDSDAMIGAQVTAYNSTNSGNNLNWVFAVILDPDGDGLSDTEEWGLGTDPYKPDTDWDGLTDGEEVLCHGTDPLYWDSDYDGLSDYAEVIYYGTDPWDYDSDDDGLSDYEEVSESPYPDPLDWDSDDDGLSDYEEVKEYGTDPWYADTDGDTLSDYEELRVLNSDPLTSLASPITVGPGGWQSGAYDFELTSEAVNTLDAYHDEKQFSYPWEIIVEGENSYDESITIPDTLHPTASNDLVIHSSGTGPVYLSRNGTDEPNGVEIRADHVTLADFEIMYFDKGVQVGNYAQGVEIEDVYCHDNYIGFSGDYNAPPSFTLRRCTAAHNDFGMYLYGDDWLVENCVIDSNYYDGLNGYGDRVEVVSSTIRSHQYYGLYIQCTESAAIERNEVTDSYHLDCYGYGGTGTVTVRNNVFDFWTASCYLNFGAGWDVTVENNTFSSGGDLTIDWQSASGGTPTVTMRNNIFCAGGELTVTFDDYQGQWDLAELDSDYNDWHSDAGSLTFTVEGVPYDLTEWRGLGKGLHSISADPLFYDRWMNDFHLVETSPCIDAGDPASDWSAEPPPNGDRINMGAYGGTWEATTSSVRPVVVSTDPEDGAALVGVLTDVTLTFSAPMDTSSVESVFSMTRDGTEVTGVWQWTSNYDLGVFQPWSPLAFGATYTVTLEATAKDLYGVPLAGVPYFFSFTTAPEPAGWPTPGQPPSGGLISVTLSHGLDQLPDGRNVTNHPFDIQVSAPGATDVALSGADSYDVQGMTLLDVTFDADRGYAMLVSAWNDAGDYGEAPITVVWDTTPPTIRITKIADPVITDPGDLLSPPFGFLWLNDDMDNIARNVYNAALFNVEFTADDLPAPVFHTSYGFYNIGAHHDAIAVPYGNDMARDYEYPYPKDNDIIRLGDIVLADPLIPPEMLPLEAAPGTGAVLAAPEAWRWEWGDGVPIGGGKFRVGAQVFSDLVDLGLYETQLLLLQATDHARNTQWAFMVFTADLWEDQFFSIPKFWSYSHFPHVVSLPYDAREVSLGGGSLARLSYNYIEEEVNYSLWGLPTGVMPPGWMSWNNKWVIGDVWMKDFAGNTGTEKLEVFRWSWSDLSLPKVPWYALDNEQAYYMLPAGVNERARCIAGDERERVFSIGAGDQVYTYKDIYENDHTFKYFGYQLAAPRTDPPLWLLPRQGEDLQPRLNGVKLQLTAPPETQVSVTPYLKTLKASAVKVAEASTVGFTGWQGDYPGERWLQHAGWTELSLSFSGKVRLPSEDEDRDVGGTSFHPKTVNLVRVVPSVAAVGSKATFRIRAGDLWSEWDVASVWFYKEGVDITAQLNASDPVIVYDDPLNQELVQAIDVTIDIPDDDQYLGLWDIEIMTPWVYATMPGLPAGPGPLPLQPYAGLHGGVMLPRVLNVRMIDLVSVSFLDGGAEGGGDNEHPLFENSEEHDGWMVGPAIEGPVWLDANLDGDVEDEDDKNFPACYTRSKPDQESRIRLEAVVRVARAGVGFNVVAKRGDVEYLRQDGLTSTGQDQTISGTVAGDALPGTIDKLALQLNWQVELVQGGPPVDFATTNHDVFVTLDTPITTTQAGTTNTQNELTPKRLEAVIEEANAKGVADRISAADAVHNWLAGYDIVTTLDRPQLTDDWVLLSKEIVDRLKYRGHCKEQAILMSRATRILGIPSEWRHVYATLQKDPDCLRNQAGQMRPETRDCPACGVTEELWFDYQTSNTNDWDPTKMKPQEGQGCCCVHPTTNDYESGVYYAVWPKRKAVSDANRGDLEMIYELTCVQVWGTEPPGAPGWFDACTGPDKFEPKPPQ